MPDIVTLVPTAPEAGLKVTTGAARAGVLSERAASNATIITSEKRRLWHLAERSAVFMLTSLWREFIDSFHCNSLLLAPRLGL